MDALRIVWHGHYLKYMELARTELLRSVGLDIEELRATRHGFLVIESACRHVSPLHYGDRVRVTAWLRDVTYRIQIAYDIENATQSRRAARAYTTLVTVDSSGKMLLQTPRPILECLSKASRSAGSSVSSETIR